MAESELTTASLFKIGDIIQNVEGKTFVVTAVDLTPGSEKVSIAQFNYGEELPTKTNSIIDNATTNTSYRKIGDSKSYNQELISRTDVVSADAASELTRHNNKNSSKMDFAKISEVLSQMQSTISTFDSSATAKTTTSIYTELTDAWLEGGFAQSYDTALNNLITGLNHMQSTIAASAENMAAIDDTVTPPPPPPPPEDNNPEGTPAYTPTKETLINNAKEQLEGYQKMSMNDLSDVAKELNSLANKEGKSFEEIINNEQYAEKVRNVLLLNQNVPEDLKQLLTDGDSKVTQSVLRKIFNGNEASIIGLDNNTKITLTKFLTIVADSNNLSLNSLINDESNSKLLKDALGHFNTVQHTFHDLTDAQMKEQILNIYDGNNVHGLDSGAVSIIRNHADSLVGENQSVENIIESDSLVTKFKTLGKFSIFAGNLTGYSDSSVTSILKNIIK